MTAGPTPVSVEELLAQSTWLRRLAATLVAGDAAADDLVQETWLVALRHPPLGGRSPRPWLARIARNLAANLRRSEGRRRAHESAVSAAEPPLDPAALAGEIDAQRVLAEAVLRLDEPLRSAIVLRYLRGLDSRAIGRLSGVPDGTARWRLKQALEELRADLDRHGGDRRAWCTAFAALVPRRFETTAGGGLATGAALMSTGTKIGLGLAAAAALVTWTLFERGAPAARVTRDAQVARAEAPPAIGGDALTAHPAPGAAREAATAPAPRPVEPETAACCVVGRVLDPYGRGLPGARVLARAQQFDGMRRQSGEEIATAETTSGVNGAFSLPLEPERPFVLSVSHAAHAPVAAGPVFAGERLDLWLDAGGMLAVDVFARSGEQSVPRAGAHVRVLIDGPDAAGALWEESGTTGADGSVAFASVPAGAVQVEARSELRLGRRQVETDGAGDARCRIELLDTGRIDGTVVERDTGRPIAGARVGSSYQGIEDVTTDALGRFALSGIELGEGNWTLGARVEGYATAFELVRLPPGGEHRTVTFELERALHASGRLVDTARRPVPLAQLLFLGSIPVEPYTADHDRVHAATDAAGRFAVELRPGIAYRVLARAPGHGLALSACGPFPGGDAPVDLGEMVLESAASLAGVVAGEPELGTIALVRLHWVDADPPPRLPAEFAHVETTRADSAGRFAFAGLAPGRYRVELAGKGRSRAPPVAEAFVDLAPGEARRGLVLGGSGPTLAGTVTDASGSALGNCAVKLFALAAPERVVASTSTDRKGRFQLVAPDAGPFRIVVDEPRLFFDSRSIEPVEAGAELAIELAEFRSPHSIRGVLLPERGVLPENLYVSFRDARTQERLARVAIPDPDGAFTMENLRDVPYDLELVDFAGLFEPVRIDGVRPGGEEVELRLVPRR